MCSANTASNTDARTTSGSRVASGVDASAAVATVNAPQAATPAAKTQTRAVPRSRIVARRALYSSCSRSVIVPLLSWSDRERPIRRLSRETVAAAIVAQELVRAELWMLSCIQFCHPGSENSLAVYELSATLPSVAL